MTTPIEDAPATHDADVVLRVTHPDDGLFLSDRAGTFERGGLVLEIRRGTVREVSRALASADDRCAYVIPFRQRMGHRGRSGSSRSRSTPSRIGDAVRHDL